jgi:hypothetical protein
MVHAYRASHSWHGVCCIFFGCLRTADRPNLNSIHRSFSFQLQIVLACTYLYFWIVFIHSFPSSPNDGLIPRSYVRCSLEAIHQLGFNPSLGRASLEFENHSRSTWIFGLTRFGKSFSNPSTPIQPGFRKRH